MKILHAADIHAKRDRWPEARDSLRAMAEAGRRQAVDLFAIAGDLADGPLQNSERDVFDALAAEVQALADIAPVAIIYGTPTHDAPGSLEAFERLRARFPIVLLRPGIAYFLDHGKITTERGAGAEAILFGIPEPTKKWLLAEAGAIGKDDSDAQVRAAMRALLLGLGGLRQQHPNLPCVLLYHGEISGAKTATGYGSEPGTGIALSRDDLVMVGADYIGLGHIHEPQQIPGLDAYYPGSAYPLTWGETHKAGANLVTFRYATIDDVDPADHGYVPEVSRVEFPHAQRVKLSTRWPSTAVLPSFEGKLAWLEITAMSEEARGINLEKELEALIRGGALPGSRVTLNVLPTETVRASAIAEKRRLRDKIGIWAEASALTVPETVLAKADELEREGTAGGGIGQGAHIRIDRLILRGAKGLYKKSRKDEIDLNLEVLGSAVIAFASPNGAGKTTILENLTPWPQMLTRAGTLKEHFRLKDSCRDLYFTDMRSGWRYRALITIRADIASGGAEYFLWRDQGDGRGMVAVEGVTGRKEPYEAAIGRLFGSLALYLKSAFVTQRPAKDSPDLAEATQTQRKALFVELAGIDYLEAYRAAAKARGDANEAVLGALDGAIAAAADVDEKLERAAAEISEAEGRRARAAADVEKITEEGLQLKAERDAIAERVKAFERTTERRQAVADEIRDLLAEIKEAEDSIALFREAAAGRDAAEKELAQIGKLETEATALREEKAGIDKANHDALAAHSRAAADARGRQDEARAALDAIRRQVAAAERAAAVARAQVGEEPSDKCSTCGQALPEGLYDPLLHEFHQREAEAERLETEATEIQKKVAPAEEALAAIQIPPTPATAPFPGAARLEEIEGEMAWLSAEKARETIRKADEAKVRIETAEAAKGKAETRRAAAAEEERELGAQIQADTSRADLAAKEGELESVRTRLSEAKSAGAAAQAAADAARRAEEDARARQKARDEARAKREGAARERDEWRLLERAVGSDGIQALELDALAPSIAAVANRLLGEAYGSRYQIEFRTQRTAGKGSKTKLVEDFEIFIIDTESGEEQTIDSLSGGEAVWIRKALYDGFAIIRAQNTDMRFLTVFLDEADGALDPEARMLYLRMLEAAHRESGRYQTIIVTHSTELQASVERVINVADLGPRPAEDGKGVAA